MRKYRSTMIAYTVHTSRVRLDQHQKWASIEATAISARKLRYQVS